MTIIYMSHNEITLAKQIMPYLNIVLSAILSISEDLALFYLEANTNTPLPSVHKQNDQ